MERVPTGIAELDAKLSGGYPKGKGLLVTGVSGAGKTIFGLHLLYQSLRGRHGMRADRNRRDA